MLQKNQFLFALAFFISAIFTGCTKEDQAPGTDPSLAKKLAKIAYEDGSYDAISYLSNGAVEKVTRFVNSGGNGQTETLHFAYTGNLLSEIKSTDASRFVYSYDGARLAKLDYYNPAGTLVTRYEFSFTQERLTSMQVFFSATGNLPGNPTYRHELDYYESGNLKKLTILSRNQANNQLVKTSEFVIEQYDAKFNTSTLFESYPFLPLKLTTNNPVLEKHYTPAGTLTETVSHAYTYDDKGNPLTRKTTTKSIGANEQVENVMFHY